MPRGGNYGGRKRRSPAASLDRLRGFAATQPEQLSEWTMEELYEAERLSKLAAGRFADEQARRFEAADDAEDAAETRKILDELARQDAAEGGRQ